MTTLASRLRNYSELTRQRAPVGWLLLLFPTLSALVVSAEVWPSAEILVVFTLGVWLTRSAGCVVNDYADRHLDPQVARTRTRPLADGRVSPSEAIGVFLVLICLAALLLLFLSHEAALTALLSLPLILLYPFAKRVTQWPQIVLGLAFSWGVLVASVEMAGSVSEPALWLFVANFLWILAYDTLYALQDLPDDLKVGVGSLATRFGIEGSLRLIALCQCGMLIALVLLGVRSNYPWSYFAFLVGILLMFAYQHLKLGREQHRQEMGYFRAFKHNAWVGLLMLFGLTAAKAGL